MVFSMERKLTTTHLFLFTITLIICWVSSTGVAFSGDSRPDIEYVYPDQSIWTTQRDSDGLLKNPLLHVAENLFSDLKLDWRAKPYPANRMFDRLESGKSNFSFLVQAARLQESCIFSKSPVTYSELRVYKRSGASPIKTVENFKGKQVITILGYSYGKIGRFLKDPKNEVVIYEAGRHDSAFAMLNHARADYLLDYSGPSEEVLKAESIQDVSYEVLTRLDVFLVLSKKYPDAHKIMSSMEEAVQSIDVTQWGLKRP